MPHNVIRVTPHFTDNDLSTAEHFLRKEDINPSNYTQIIHFRLVPIESITSFVSALNHKLPNHIITSINLTKVTGQSGTIYYDCVAVATSCQILVETFPHCDSYHMKVTETPAGISYNAII